MAQTRSHFNSGAHSRRYGDVLERLTALEAELADAAKGTGLPADPQLTQLVTQSLVNDYPLADIQIVVSSSRKSTTTKQCYETETPGMVGLDTEKLRELQRQLMEKISLPGFDTKAPKSNGDDSKNGTSHHGTEVPPSSDPIQHKSSVEEVFANEDGTLISKKLTRIVTTSHSAVSGIGNDFNDEKYGSEKDDNSSPRTSIGSVRDRIAIFESLKDTTPSQSQAISEPIVKASVFQYGQKTHEEQKYTNDTKEEVDDNTQIQSINLYEAAGIEGTKERSALNNENILSTASNVPTVQESGAYYAITRKDGIEEPSSTERTEESTGQICHQFESIYKPEKKPETDFSDLRETILSNNRSKQENEEQITSILEQSQPIKYAELRSTTSEEPRTHRSEEEIYERKSFYGTTEMNDLEKQDTEIDSKEKDHDETTNNSEEPKSIIGDNEQDHTKSAETTDVMKHHAEPQEIIESSEETSAETRLPANHESESRKQSHEDPKQIFDDSEDPKKTEETADVMKHHAEPQEIIESGEETSAETHLPASHESESRKQSYEDPKQIFDDSEDPKKTGETADVMKHHAEPQEIIESGEETNAQTRASALNYISDEFVQKTPEHDSMPNIYTSVETDNYSFSISQPFITETTEPEGMSIDDNQNIKEVISEVVKNEPEYCAVTETTTVLLSEATSDNAPSAKMEEAKFLSDDVEVNNEYTSSKEVNTKEIYVKDSSEFNALDYENNDAEQINQAKQTTDVISRQSSGIVESNSYPEIQKNKAYLDDERAIHDIPKIPHLIVEEEASNKSDEEEDETTPYEHPLPRYQQKRMNEGRQDSANSVQTTSEQSEIIRDETPTPLNDNEKGGEEFPFYETTESRETENIIPHETTGEELESQNIFHFTQSMSIQEHKPAINQEIICIEQIARYDSKAEERDDTNFLASSQENEEAKTKNEDKIEHDLDEIIEKTPIKQFNDEDHLVTKSEILQISQQITDKPLFKSKDITQEPYASFTEMSHSISGGIVESESYEQVPRFQKGHPAESQNSIDLQPNLHENSDPHEDFHSIVVKQITTITPHEINLNNTEYNIQSPAEDINYIETNVVEIAQEYPHVPSEHEKKLNAEYNTRIMEERIGEEFPQDVVDSGSNEDNISFNAHLDRNLSITPPLSIHESTSNTKENEFQQIEKISEESEKANITVTGTVPFQQSNSTEFSSLNDSFETSTTGATVIPARKNSLSISNNSNTEMSNSVHKDLTQSARTTPILMNEEIVEYTNQTRSLSQQQHYEQLGAKLQSHDEGQRSSLVPEEISVSVEENKAAKPEMLISEEQTTKYDLIEDEYDIINSEDLPKHLKQANNENVEEYMNILPKTFSTEEKVEPIEHETEKDTTSGKEKREIVNQDKEDPENFSPKIKNYKTEGRDFQIQPRSEYDIEHEGEHVIELSPGETEEHILSEARRALEEERILENAYSPTETLTTIIKQPTIVDSESIEFSNLSGPEIHIRTDEKEILHDVQDAKNEVPQQSSVFMNPSMVNIQRIQQTEETYDDKEEQQHTTTSNIELPFKKENVEIEALKTDDIITKYDEAMSVPFDRDEDTIPMDPLPPSTISEYEIHVESQNGNKQHDNEQIRETTTDLMQSKNERLSEDSRYTENNLDEDEISIRSGEKQYEIIDEAELIDYDKQIPESDDPHNESNEIISKNFDVIYSEDIPKKDEQISTSEIEDIIQTKAKELVKDVFANLETSPKIVKIKDEKSKPTFEHQFYPIVREDTEDLEYDGDENDAELEFLNPENIERVENDNNRSSQLTLMIKEEQFRPKSPIPPAVLTTASKFDEEVKNGDKTLEDADDVFISSPIEMVHIERIIDSPPPDTELLFEVPRTSSIDQPLEKLAKMKELPQLNPDFKKDASTLESPSEEREFANFDENVKSRELFSEDYHSGSSSASSLKKGVHYDELALAAAGDNISSEGSLQEFERIEKEVVNKRKRENIKSADGSPTKSSITDEEKLLIQQAGTTGSITSLTEFENLEREIVRSAATNERDTDDSALATVIAEQDDVMVLSDIREESEAEEGREHDDRMSTREDDEEDDMGGDMDSLSEKPPQNTKSSVQTHQSEGIQNALQDVMLSSADSLELGLRHAQLTMETSADSLEPSYPHYNYGTDISDKKQSKEGNVDGENDSLFELGMVATHSHNPSADTGHMTADTDTTFQEYQQGIDDDVVEKGEAIARSYPTTVTTFETTKTRDDGTMETITRRLQTRITDPVHSRIRFTGTEDENRLRNIQQKSDDGQPVESVDEEGNITTIICHRTPNTLN